MAQITITEPQEDFIFATDKYPAFVGGFGSGKTEALVNRALRLKMEYRRQQIAFYEPTWDLVRQIAFPRFEEKLELMGLPYKLIKSPQNIIQIEDFGSVIFRSMEEPTRIVGYEVADSLVDELDTLKRDHAAAAWRAIIARNRQKKPDAAINSVGVGTTPEGFRFVYERWVKSPGKGCRLIKAPTHSNPFLPADYIASLEDQYPSNLLAAYLMGEFVNLTSGSVYHEFDRKLNGTFERIEPGEPLHVGMDFNVNNMTAVVSVLRGGEPLTLDELTGIRDTPVMCQALKERFEGHRILVYPDASGNSSKSVNASVTDLAILRQAGFSVVVNPSNPRVKDRVLSLNRMIHADNKRRWKVNPDRCPVLVEALERQAYDKNGEPDKKSGFDHCPDALGYFIAMKYPVHKPVLSGQIKFN